MQANQTDGGIISVAGVYLEKGKQVVEYQNREIKQIAD